MSLPTFSQSERMAAASFFQFVDSGFGPIPKKYNIPLIAVFIIVAFVYRRCKVKHYSRYCQRFGGKNLQPQAPVGLGWRGIVAASYLRMVAGGGGRRSADRSAFSVLIVPYGIEPPNNGGNHQHQDEMRYIHSYRVLLEFFAKNIPIKTNSIRNPTTCQLRHPYHLHTLSLPFPTAPADGSGPSVACSSRVSCSFRLQRYAFFLKRPKVFGG